ncbi:hypothetical protein ACFQU2_10330 [Siccirubricoccus deserti]
MRAAVAANAATPQPADRILAGDGDAGVRAELGRKLAPGRRSSPGQRTAASGWGGRR